MSIRTLRSDLHSSATTSPETIRVLIAPHPLSSQKIELRALSGLTIKQMADLAAAETHISDLATSVLAYLDGHVVEQSNWHLVRPKTGGVLVFRAVAEDPLTAGITALFTAISTAASGVTLTGVLGSVLGAGLSFGASLLLNALFPVRPPQMSSEGSDRGKQAYSISGSRNQATPYDAIPQIFGSMRVTPPYAAQPYTESVNDDQYWVGVFTWGYGNDAFLTDLKIGETPIGFFQDHAVEHSWINNGTGELSLYQGQTVEEALNIDLEESIGWVSRTSATGVTSISIDIMFPSGLYGLDKKDGKRGAYGVDFQAQYRPVGSTNWIDIHTPSVHLRTVDPVRRSFKADGLPVGQYEIQVRRMSPDDSVIENENYAPFSKTSLVAIRGVRPAKPIDFPHPLLRTAVRIRASQNLNGALDSLNGVMTAYVDAAFNGTTYVANQPSRNPSDQILHILRGDANARPVADNQIDWPAFIGFWRHCQTKGFWYDACITSSRSIPDMIAEIAAAGRAFAFQRDNKWTVVWDNPDAPIVQLLTPRNSWGFESHRQYVIRPHGFRVRFINRANGFQEDEVTVYDDGFDASNATLFENIEFPGITDQHNAWRHARYQLAQLKLRPETITLNVDFEHLIATRGDRVRVQHDVMLLGETSGRIKNHSSGFLNLDQKVTVEAGKRYTFRWRDHAFNIQSWTFTGLTTGEHSRLPWSGAVPAEGELFSWGEAEIETAVYRILRVENQDGLTARLTLVDDAPAIAFADQGTIPVFQSNVSAPADPFLMPPTDFAFSQEAYAEGEAWFAKIHISWNGARAGRVVRFEVAMMDHENGFFTGIGSTPPDQKTFTASRLDEGTYTFRVRSIFDDGSFSNWMVSEAISTTVLLDPPADVLNFNISTMGENSVLTWTATPDAVTYEIRFIAEVGDTTWNSATPLLIDFAGTAAQVPSRSGTYLIKARKGNGIRSRNATIITTNVGSVLGLNIIEVLNESGFEGSRDNLELIDGQLRLLPRNVISRWTTLEQVANLDEGLEGPGSASKVEPTGTYFFKKGIDLGASYTSRLTGSIKAEGIELTNVMANWPSLDAVALLDNIEPEDWNVELQYRTSDVAPALNQWGDWRLFVVGDVTARALQFRLKLSGVVRSGADFSTVTPLVSAVSVHVDMPDRIEADNDVIVPPEGLSVPFKNAFAALPTISISAQSLATGDRYIVTNKNSSGFDIRFFSANNSPIGRTFDYLAKGYGHKQ